MTTQQLIPVVPAAIGSQTVQTVDGRALHTFLEVQTHFRDWIDRRIEEYSFEEDKDFRSFLSESTGGRPTKEYALALDMAKELAMVERNAKGKAARQYFIECERRLMEAAKPAELTREQILVMALESERERLRLAAELEAAQPMIQFHDEIAQGAGEFTIRETVKALFNRSISEQQLSGWLRQQGWLCQSSREPTAWAMDRGMMRLRTEYLPACGKTILVPVLTGHGFTLLRHLYRTGELFTAGISADRLLAAPSQAA